MLLDLKTFPGTENFIKVFWVYLTPKQQELISENYKTLFIYREISLESSIRDQLMVYEFVSWRTARLLLDLMALIAIRIKTENEYVV